MGDYWCNECDARFTERYSYDRHMIQYHPIVRNLRRNRKDEGPTQEEIQTAIHSIQEALGGQA